jgi:hypothetical protein
VPEPPSIAALTARIMVDIKRDGYSLISYEELRTAWPTQWATAAQAGIMGMIAIDQNLNFSYQRSGVVFTNRPPDA